MGKEKPPSERPPAPTGPRGGTTTITARGHIRANLWLSRDQHERLRVWAFKLRRTKTDLLREGLDRLLSKLEAEEQHGTGHDRGEERGSP